MKNRLIQYSILLFNYANIYIFYILFLRLNFSRIDALLLALLGINTMIQHFYLAYTFDTLKYDRSNFILIDFIQGQRDTSDTLYVPFLCYKAHDASIEMNN